MLQTATIEVNGNELQVIYAGLDELQGKIGRPVFAKIQAQIAEQIAAHEAAEQAKATDAGS